MMHELVKSISIENLVAQRDGVASKIRDAHELLQQAQEQAEAINAQIRTSTTMAHHQTVDVGHACFDRHSSHHLANEDGADKAIAHIDASLWDLLLKESGLLSFMDAAARTQWAEQVAEGKHPTLTKDNVNATFDALLGARGEMFERGVLNLFRSLSWDYKSNEPVRFGKKIILTWACSIAYRAGTLSLGYETRNKLADVVRVFSVVDGKPEPDHRDQFPGEVLRGEDNEHDYFKIRAYKKGTVHVIFTRPKLVDDLNRIVAKHHPHALPPAS